MNKERYQKTMVWLENHPRLTKFFILTEKFCELFVYIVYPTFLTYLAYHNPPFFLRSTLICFIPFVLVSVLRKVLNAKRPYEVYGVSDLGFPYFEILTYFFDNIHFIPPLILFAEVLFLRR